MSFQIYALPGSSFQHLFELTDDELLGLDARKVRVDSKPGFPCRITLRDAEIGETMMLVHYQHLDEATPYRAGHAILVGKGKEEALPDVDEVPQALMARPISLRGFDDQNMLIDCDLAEGEQVAATIDRMFKNPRVAFIHLHNAKPGCYAARAVRAIRTH